MPTCFDELTDSSESEGRHIVINALVLSFGNQIGFMPNTNIAAAADILAKARPGRQMGEIRALRISGESLKRSPVLKKQNRSSKPYIGAHKAEIRSALELLKHARHRKENRQPLDSSSNRRRRALCPREIRIR